jgi:Protein of unknown function (DUF3017)
VGRQWPLLFVLFGCLSSFAVVALDHFRAGCFGFGISVGFAALARTFLPARRVGLLVVRSRPFDLVVLYVMAGALVVLAIIVPQV